MDPIGLIVLVAGGLLVGSIVVLVKRQAGKRTEAVRVAADRLGWGFREEVPFDTIPDLDRFELFQKGRSRKMRNLLTSPAGDPRAVVFDFSYVTGGGNSQATHRQTIFYATSDALELPAFSLRPETFFHRAAGIFGYEDIDLDRRPEFSRLFLLRGRDELRIRETFDGAVAEFFERHPGTCAAGMGRELLYWRPGRLARPDELEILIREGLELASRFTPAARSG